VTDGRTDTGGQQRPRLRIALRGKTEIFWYPAHCLQEKVLLKTDGTDGTKGVLLRGLNPTDIKNPKWDFPSPQKIGSGNYFIHPIPRKKIR